MDDIQILFSTSADTLVAGDQIVVEGDHIEIHKIDDDREDIDEILVIGYSHDSGDRVEYSLFADDEFEVWSI